MTPILSRLFLATMLWLCASGGAWAMETVTLKLKWSHSFQFAGYYAAKAQGYYRDAGLDVHFSEGNPGDDAVADVISGRAQFGSGSSSLLLNRTAHAPVVVLAVIFQHSPYVLIANPANGIRNIHDLAGKRIMVEPLAEELEAYLLREGISPKDYRQIPLSHDIRDLTENRTDAIFAYNSVQPFYLDQAGFEYRIFSPRAAGIDFYGDNLFTSEYYLNSHPQEAKAFREASLKGWDYAMAHPDEIIDLILREYSQQQPREKLQFEAREMRNLIQPEHVDIGYMYPGRWQHIASVYTELGMLSDDFSIEGFLYDPNPKVDLTWLYYSLLISLGGVIVLGGFASFIHTTNRRLKISLAELNEAKIQLDISHQKYQTLTESMRDVVWIIDAESRRFTYISPSVQGLRGYMPEEVLAASLADSLMPESFARVQEGIAERLPKARSGELKEDQYFTHELEQRCKNGGSVWTEVILHYCRNPQSGRIEIRGVSRDISERRLAEEKIRHMAQHDSLTSLPNRMLFSELTERALASARREQTRLALVFVDLDKFKPVNDTYGHGVGDLLLKEVAIRIRQCLRDSDTVGRIGGDEFVMLLPQVGSAENALVIANKVRETLNRPFLISGKTLAISSSMGVALYPEHGANQIDLEAHADFAMYHAKASGRNQVSLFSPNTPQQ
ncbi:MAG: diguanylate cyclase [Gallionella sp.]|jgi:diguanylate cyclase (GGDEF)-like protein/PAS domain S-box-containing protein|nr:diguanylate cyclase [Gallionella sp.]